MKRIKLFIASFAIAMFGALAVVPTTTSYAYDPLANCSDPGNADNAVCKNVADEDPNVLIKNLINTLLFIVGILSVAMLIYGGIRYTTSAGNSAAITGAKNTIIYSIVGLVVSFLAFAVVNWVVNLF